MLGACDVALAAHRAADCCGVAADEVEPRNRKMRDGDPPGSSSAIQSCHDVRPMSILTHVLE
jgi:hypothetical protein